MTKVILSTSAAYIAARTILGDHRKVYDSIGDAISAVRAIYAKDGFPADFPVVAAKLGTIDFAADDTIPPVSEWPAAYSTAGVQIAVSFIGVRGVETGEVDPKTNKPKVANGAKGFAIYPLFNVDAITASDSGGTWLWKVIEKEMSHVAFRGLRAVSDLGGIDELAAAAKMMPVAVEDYVEEATRASTETSAFDDTWANFRKLLKGESSTALLVDALPQKAEVIKALRSKAYATENYGDLESMGAFVFIGNTMVQVIEIANKAAIEAGNDTVDSGEIAAWIAKRDNFVFPAQVKKTLEAGAVDFGAFMGKFGINQSA